MAGQSGTPAPVVIDASVWAAFYLTLDSTHATSYKWIDEHTAAGGILIAPSILLIEVAAAISRRLGQSQTALHAARAIEQLNLMRIVPMETQLIREATNIAAAFGLRGADAIYVATARQLNLPLLTWDQDQHTKPASIITAIRP